uniref:Uncharacterized protein n=1 Tax=Parascaris equorum TaxID=6256 RepID=A0A914RNX9_PAREQ
MCIWNASYPVFPILQLQNEFLRELFTWRERVLAVTKQRGAMECRRRFGGLHEVPRLGGVQPQQFHSQETNIDFSKEGNLIFPSLSRIFFRSFPTKKWRALTMGGVRRETVITFLFDISWNATQNRTWLLDFFAAVGCHKTQFSVHTILIAAHFLVAKSNYPLDIPVMSALLACIPSLFHQGGPSRLVGKLF